MIENGDPEKGGLRRTSGAIPEVTVLLGEIATIRKWGGVRERGGGWELRARDTIRTSRDIED